MSEASTTVTAHAPIRTCVGCRATAPQAELVRVAVVGGRAVADPRRRAPGRGAYLHARPACVAAAGKGLARSLKRAVGKAEVDGLTREILAPAVTAAVAGGSALTDVRRTVADTRHAGDTGETRVPADPGIISSGHPHANAVEIGSPSSTRSMSARPTSSDSGSVPDGPNASPSSDTSTAASSGEAPARSSRSSHGQSLHQRGTRRA